MCVLLYTIYGVSNNHNMLIYLPIKYGKYILSSFDIGIVTFKNVIVILKKKNKFQLYN